MTPCIPHLSPLNIHDTLKLFRIMLRHPVSFPCNLWTSKTFSKGLYLFWDTLYSSSVTAEHPDSLKRLLIILRHSVSLLCHDWTSKTASKGLKLFWDTMYPSFVTSEYQRESQRVYIYFETPCIPRLSPLNIYDSLKRFIIILRHPVSLLCHRWTSKTVSKGFKLFWDNLYPSVVTVEHPRHYQMV